MDSYSECSLVGASGDGCEADKGGGRVESESEDEKEELYAPISG